LKTSAKAHNLRIVRFNGCFLHHDILKRGKTMFAMFDDIYRNSTHDERERVERYCSATGADWAKTFYTESGWNSFLSWERDPETWIADPSAMFFDA
jgi:hypothetical protein